MPHHDQVVIHTLLAFACSLDELLVTLLAQPRDHHAFAPFEQITAHRLLDFFGRARDPLVSLCDAGLGSLNEQILEQKFAGSHCQARERFAPGKSVGEIVKKLIFDLKLGLVLSLRVSEPLQSVFLVAFTQFLYGAEIELKLFHPYGLFSRPKRKER